VALQSCVSLASLRARQGRRGRRAAVSPAPGEPQPCPCGESPPLPSACSALAGPMTWALSLACRCACTSSCPFSRVAEGVGVEVCPAGHGHSALCVWPCFRTCACLSQNHRVAGVGRDLCGSSSPTPCPSRVAYSRLQRTSSRQVSMRAGLRIFGPTSSAVVCGRRLCSTLLCACESCVVSCTSYGVEVDALRSILVSCRTSQ